MSKNFDKKVKKKLFIKKMRFSCDSTYDEFNNFDSFENLMHFSIDSQLNYLENKSIPKLDLPQERTRLRLNLEEGFNEVVVKQKLITNYNNYRNQKWTHFLKCLIDNQIIAKEKPDFVSFGGLISDVLSAFYLDFQPNETLFALRFRGFDYLFYLTLNSIFLSLET
jgi:hypothetical protein